MSNINPAGATAGYYYDANRNTHGILRYSDNAFAEFDVPGGAESVAGINPAGAITEEYRDENGCHGFVRTLDGTFTTIDRPGTTLTSVNTTFTTFDLPGSIFTFPQAVNPSGAMRSPAGTSTLSSYVATLSASPGVQTEAGGAPEADSENRTTR